MFATMTIRDMRNELKKIGFFHATGLPIFNAQHDDEYHTIQANYNELGSWGSDGHWIIVVLENGEVWLRAYTEKQPIDRNILRRLCPKGRRAVIPFSSLDIIYFYYIALRMANPRDNCEGSANPIPQPRQ